MPSILYIDDDIHYARMIVALLTPHGFQVDTAEDGLEGLRKARELEPDLILLDLYLPRVSGLELIGQLQSEPLTRNIPLVVMTALPLEQSRQLVDGTGVQDCIAKPFKPDELTAILHRILHRPAHVVSRPSRN